MAGLLDLTEAQKKAVLDIGAQTGLQGVQAYQQGLQAVNQDQQQALSNLGGQANLIGASGAAQDQLKGYVNPSFDLMRGALSLGQANFQQAQQVNQNATLNALTHLGSLDALLKHEADMANAAKAASSGGGGGGGGGGRGGSGGTTKTLADLTDTKLRTLATGAATTITGADRNLAAQQLAQAAQARAQTSTARGQTKQRIIQAVGPQIAQRVLATNPNRGLNYQAQAIQQRIQALQAKRQQLIKARKGKGPLGMSTPNINAELARLNTARTQLLPARRFLAGVAGSQQEALKNAYGQAVATYGEPAGPIAQQWLAAQGLDPNRAAGIITPTQEKSFRLAAADELKRAGGPLGIYGQVPLVRPADTQLEKEIGLKAPKIRQMRQSPNYRTLASAIEDSLAKGESIDSVMRGLQSWTQPYWQKVATVSNASGAGAVRTKGNTQVQTVNGSERVVARRVPGHANLVKLILADYRPAFGRGYNMVQADIPPELLTSDASAY